MNRLAAIVDPTAFTTRHGEWLEAHHVVPDARRAVDELVERYRGLGLVPPARERLRVLHVLGSLAVGGSEKLTVDVVTALDRTRFDVAVLALRAGGPLKDEVDGAGVPVHIAAFPDQPWRAPLATFRAVVRVLRVLFGGWDIVHTHLFLASVACAVPARLAGARLFGTVHRIYFPRVQPRVERLLAPLHERVVVDSEAALDALQSVTRVPRHRYVAISNGVDTDHFAVLPDTTLARERLGVPPDTVVVTEVAHLRPHKGQRHLVEAFARIASRHPRAMLLFVGDGPDRAALESSAAQHGVGSRVVFAGARRDLAHVFAASNVVALPSEHEGFGYALAEASAAGLPVLGGDRGGATEVIVDGETGFLVPFADVEALARRLDLLLGDDDLRRQLGAAGRAHIRERFSSRRMIEKYEQLYVGPSGTGGGGRRRRH